MPRFPTHVILGPRHVHPGVNTPADYRRAHVNALEQGRRQYPNLDWPSPWRSVARTRVIVAGGAWQVPCATSDCVNFPAYDPEWGIACCWECGAVYELAPPEEWREAERVLVNRPARALRNWNWPALETIEMLRAQNREQGDPD